VRGRLPEKRQTTNGGSKLVDSSLSSDIRFHIVKLHMQGGLGEVFVARDEELHREVALKKIRASQADNSESRSRFLREALITGALEHPGIVPVYGLGELADGRPFYAMRFIRGETFRQACDRFHQSRQAGQPLELRQLLGRLIAVCNTVAYAHSKGVLHRDLKPDNIMLGNFGETLVVDWGVAKSADEPPEDVRAHAPDCTATDVTMVGRTVGTLQFMSPEQAGGLLDQLTPASDVYSLGATLYYLLTGLPPFAGLDRALAVLLVQGCDFKRPRQVNADVPAPLEAICLKAMACRPEARYQSARALADDLERWLADEAVRAYAEPWTDRLGRWARRHRDLVAWLISGAVLALTLIVAWALVGASDQHRALEKQRADRMEEFAAERSQLQNAAENRRREAEEQSQRAESSEALARRYLYFSRINQADRAWDEAHIGRMLALLQQERDAQKDLLGFEWHYLWRLQHTSLATLEGHSQAVRAVAHSPDGQWIASGGEDKVIRIWDARTGQIARSLRGNGGPVNALAFSPDSRLLASGSDDGLVKLWDVQGTSRTPRTTYRGHTNHVSTVAYSHDGKRLASGSPDLTIRIWDAAPGGPAEVASTLQILWGHTSSITSVAFSPYDRYLASAGGETTNVFRPGEVKLWDLAGGREIASTQEHTGNVTAVRFGPDGKRLATASTDCTVKVWDLSGGPAGALRASQTTLRGHTKTVYGVAFSPDGEHLASGSGDQTIRIWEISRGAVHLTLRGHTTTVTSLTYHPTGTQLVSGSDDHTVRVWDPKVSQETRTLEGHALDVNDVRFSPDGRLLATASDDRTVKIWNALTRQEIRTLRGHQNGVNAISFRPDGQWLASASQDGRIKLWEVATGREVQTIAGPGGMVLSVAFSPDGTSLASVYQDGIVRVWDVGTPARAAALKFTARHAQQTVCCVQYSPNGRWLAGGCTDGSVTIWDATTGQEQRSWKAHDARVFCATFSPDSQTLATASINTTVKLSKFAGGQQVLTCRGHTPMVVAVVFSPDGRRLASGGDDQTIKLWDTLTGEEALTLKGHRDTVTSLAFNPAGDRLGSASDDWTVKLWSAVPLDTADSVSTRP
jgi:WD40 repeat protein/tRNA A-37 threonylcarbamoyl transferase component Bud32